MAIVLTPLPYSETALEPYISKETLQYHYGKHHATYVNKLNGLIQGSAFEDLSLEEIILQSDGGVFNNAAQIWNHTFYWHCLSDVHHQQPSDKMRQLIEKSFGSFDQFKEQFSTTACNHFGSGWAWLVQTRENTLRIISTANADLPMKHGDDKALLTCDVWEHAYYIDTRNSRPNYLESFWKIVNWKFVEEQLV
ncbi:MAG TPA: Fe-Mn family superoxide dismutase [Gammaproteobacteria bacterium]|nr:Fe-Mn family superoxide dismutase [Gammaproteobacteria bacterium]